MYRTLLARENAIRRGEQRRDAAGRLMRGRGLNTRRALDSGAVNEGVTPTPGPRTPRHEVRAWHRRRDSLQWLKL